MGIKQANTIDAHVGQRIRALRQISGISQTELGSRLGVSFQQIQKYELGKNRIGAGRIFEIARILQVPIAALYPNDREVSADAPAANELSDILDNLSRNADLWMLNRAFLRIQRPNVRRQIMALVRQIADDAEDST